MDNLQEHKKIKTEKYLETERSDAMMIFRDGNNLLQPIIRMSFWKKVIT